MQQLIRHFLLFTMLLPLAACANKLMVASGKSVHLLTSAGIERSYLLYVPQAYTGEPSALVFNFHGSGSNPKQQLEYSDYARVAEDNNFVVVMPAGQYTNSRTSQSWNADLDPQGVDDVRFTQEIIRDLQTLLNIDSRRIYSTGFSGGARMSSRLACELEDVIAAVSVIGGLQFPKDCQLDRAIALLSFHGTADQVNSYLPNENSAPYWVSGVEESLNAWVEASGCASSPDTFAINVSIQRSDWKDCNNAADLIFYRLDNAGHTWPGSPVIRDNAILGSTNRDIQASDISWDFFSSHTLPSKP